MSKYLKNKTNIKIISACILSNSLDLI